MPILKAGYGLFLKYSNGAILMTMIDRSALSNGYARALLSDDTTSRGQLGRPGCYYYRPKLRARPLSLPRPIMQHAAWWPRADRNSTAPLAPARSNLRRAHGDHFLQR